MSKIKTATGKLRAASYIRMSSEDQKDSPEQQRIGLAELMEREGFGHVEEYMDQAITGDSNRQRSGYTRLLKDAESGKFDVIVCWHLNRLSRENVMDAFEYLNRLRKVGIRVWTVAKGEVVITGDNIGELVTLMVEQHSSHEYLVNLSRDTCRGVHFSLTSGQWMGVQPFGYDRLFLDRNKVEKMRVRYGEKAQKNPDWYVTLDISQDLESVETLRWIFKRFTQTDDTMTRIARQLNDSKTPTGKGGKWHMTTIRQILSNPCYAGDTEYGGGRYPRAAKFHQVTRSGVMPAKSSQDGTESFYTRDTHPAIISREVFELAQKKMRNASFRKRKPLVFPLTGILYCGHCGGRMVGRSDIKTGYRGYICGRANAAFGMCAAYSVIASRVENVVFGKICDVLLSDENLQRMTAMAKRQGKAKKTRPDHKTAKLATAIQGLKSKLQTGSKRVLMAPTEEDAAAMVEMLKEWRLQLAELEGQIDHSDIEATQKNSRTLTERLKALRVAIESSDPSIVRRGVQQLITRIELFWGMRQEKNRFRRRYLDRGVIEWAAEPKEAITASGKAMTVHSFADESLWAKSSHLRAVELVRHLFQDKPVTASQIAPLMELKLKSTSVVLNRATALGLLKRVGHYRIGYVPVP